jgi:DNA polymerase III epsilon subunit-like protein
MLKMVLDTETTGIPVNGNYEFCRLVQVYVCFDRLEQKLYCEPEDFYEQIVYLTDDIQMSPEAQKCHGFSKEDTQKLGKPISEFLDFLERKIDNVEMIIGHNVEFDIYVLVAECYFSEKFELAEKILKKKRYCTMERNLKNNKFQKLVDLCKNMDIPTENLHNAKNDALACRKCYYKGLQNL